MGAHDDRVRIALKRSRYYGQATKVFMFLRGAGQVAIIPSPVITCHYLMHLQDMTTVANHMCVFVLYYIQPLLHGKQQSPGNFVEKTALPSFLEVARDFSIFTRKWV